ncbi:hypothetical protein RhoFasGS6_02403 [Rhodococcus fascians]|nr:hypothetical protein [Rhodococcus fascians]
MTLTMKIELITVPVTDVDRAKEFYTSIGFDADHDARPWEGIRYVQLTPPDRRAPSPSARASPTPNPVPAQAF